MSEEFVDISSRELRAEIRDFLRSELPRDWRERQAGATHADYLEFQRWWFEKVRDAGYLVPHWPAEWGGGRSLAEEAVMYQEFARADAPRLELYFVSLHHVSATLLSAGTRQQQERHLPAILEGAVWCQGFSEPNAGSDLASLQTRARRQGDVYVANGQKVWTSRGPDAEWCLLLARTDPDAPKRHGISYFLMEMDSPGVEVRPILDAVGDPHFAEVYLNDVEIPHTNLIGEENRGWQVAQSTLSAERGVTIVELAERLRGGFDRLLAGARNQVNDWGAPVLDDGQIRQELARCRTEIEALRLLCARMVDNLVRRGGVGPEASIVKVYYSELLQRMTDLALRIDGPEGQMTQHLELSGGYETGYWLIDHLRSWQWTIAGGANEIQRTLIGERVLGLPREPKPS